MCCPEDSSRTGDESRKYVIDYSRFKREKIMLQINIEKRTGDQKTRGEIL
jgi:hypothetical protein